MTLRNMNGNDAQAVRKAIDEYISGLGDQLLQLNKEIHGNPELAYNEHHAHNTLCDFFEKLGFNVTRHAYGLETAFEVIAGSEGRVVNFNAEYDALPDIGHACGHNLICISSVAGFLALAFAINKFNLKGRAQLLGTPAEEDGGGKVDLLKAGAYAATNVSLMMHPMSDDTYRPLNAIGCAGLTSIACYDLVCTYKGVTAHAAATPWEGKNALDALVSGYNNISMLRQQIEPSERIHGAFMDVPKVTNVIPSQTVAKYTIRSKTIKGVEELGQRVRCCLEAGAVATGCSAEIEETSIYADLRLNRPLCRSFQTNMKEYGLPVVDESQELMPGSTDQGNVSYAVPALHALVGIPVEDGSHNHTPGFTAAAGSAVGHERAIKSAKAMAIMGWEVLVDETFYKRISEDFELDKQGR